MEMYNEGYIFLSSIFQRIQGEYLYRLPEVP